MGDPREGVSPTGTIETGASRERIVPAFLPVLDAARAAVPGRASLYVYGSVANGTALVGTSDVDLLIVGLAAADAGEIGHRLSVRFAELCRAVEVAAAQRGDFAGEADEAYGGRIFLRHYCVHLAGPDLHSALPEFPADVRAARGFNGDLVQSAERWRTELRAGADPPELGRRLARKTLLAVAGLVSVRDRTWTTDRIAAAERWAQLEPATSDDLGRLASWAAGRGAPDRQDIQYALDGIVRQIAGAFADSIGLWGGHQQ